MNQIVARICDELEEFGQALLDLCPPDKKNTSMANSGNFFPSLTPSKLSNLPGQLAYVLRCLAPEDIDIDTEEDIISIIQEIRIFKGSFVSGLFDGNGVDWFRYTSLMLWVESTIYYAFIENAKGINLNLEILENSNAIPKELADRISSTQKEVDSLIIDKLQLQKQISSIQESHDFLDTLATSLKHVENVKEKINGKYKDSLDDYGKIEALHIKIYNLCEAAKTKEEGIDAIINKCNDAYKIATTTGLAGAFDYRAKKLNTAMLWWIVVLVAGLGIGVWIGFVRFDALNDAVTANKDIGYIWIQIFLSILGFGAPIWLAWVATKQINQTFKLSEDYAYKASIAKAYEGYRNEAARLDPKLEKELFSSALTKLDEAPLRFTDAQHHNSPLQEILNSKEVIDFFKKPPEYIVDILKSIIKKPSNSKEEKIDKKEDKE